MADTAHPGTLGTIDLTLALHFVGQTVGVGIPFSQWESGPQTGSPQLLDCFGFTQSTGGEVTADEPGTPGVDVVTAYPGASEDAQDAGGGFNQDWFERVHAMPKTKIAFGNIITQVEEEYLLHSAFRRQAVTLASVVNNTLPGTQLPNLSPPLVLQPFETALDPTTTDNSGGTALGTLVQLKVQALPDGLPLFDSNIVFDFSSPATDVEILLSGERIVLLPFEYEVPVRETLAWLTDIIEALDGREQRIALRKQPKQLFEVTYLLDGNTRQRMQAILFDWMDNAFGFPLWHERLFLTAGTSIGATSFPVADADQADFRVGGLAAIITNDYTYDVINIATVTATQITSVSPSLNAYPAGTRIVPVRTAILRRAVSGARTHVTLEELKLTFEVTDNNTGAVAGSTTPGFWTIYNSRVLFDDPNIIEGSMRQEIQRKVYRIDNETGVVSQSSNWDRAKRSHEKGFVLRNRADIYTFRQLLTALRGRQKAVWIPTFIEDLTVVAQLNIGTSTMDVEALDYVRFVRDRLPMKAFRITFTDGTSLIRSVSSSASISSTVERLTLDGTWPADRLPSEVSRVQFFELVRLDTDEVVINYPRIGLARCVVPLMRVFDDN